MLFCISVPAEAINIREVPNPHLNNQGWVTDMANLLSPETEAQLNQVLSNLEKKTGNEIAVVTVTDTAPSSSPKQFARDLFYRWGLGKRGKTYGVLFLISQDDRRVEIKTGEGTPSVLPNRRVKEIIELQIIPQFKLGEFSSGIVAGTQALVSSLEGNQSRYMEDMAKYHPEVIFLGLIGIAVIGSAVAIAKALSHPLLEPNGRSRVNKIENDEAAKCAQCRQPMEKLNSLSLISYLSKPEQAAQTLGSVSFEGWRCPKCYPNPSNSGIHIRAYAPESRKFTMCPTCKELTVERTSQILQQATAANPGQKIVIEKCYCCDYYKADVKTIPVISSDYSSGSYDGGGSSGGDCGGGGDGGSW
ncbi:TPM domain-containing protein [Scytonema hofmannii]|uniref:TPM domain-containing protein n=1 Tax=Scytonema hofmannii TaxID=34078 RepID=UPI0003495AB6|nr:TPM domain-containing protein [Scytonema hofmannii]